MDAVASPVHIQKAVGRLGLPAHDAEAIFRLRNPATNGLEAQRWQQRRPFLLARIKGDTHSAIAQLPRDVFVYLVLSFASPYTRYSESF